MLLISQNKIYQSNFKEIIRRKKEEQEFSVLRCLCTIYNSSRKILAGINYFFEECQKINQGNEFIKFVDKFKTSNEKNILYIFEKMSKGFQFQKNSIFSNVILEKIKSAEAIRSELLEFSKSNLQAFSGMANNGDEWSNKIFLISNKLLSTFEIINLSRDSRWKIDVAIFELAHWIDEAHQILNKYELEDEWSQIKDFLHEENNKTEWKSTFLTPTETLFQNDEIEKNAGTKLLSLVAEAILGMINTEGGVVLVGIIENPEKIKREDIKRMLIKKNGVTFFDINYEFQKKNINSTDLIKRKIQDCLCTMTRCGVESFNNLWTIKPVEIKNDYRSVFVYKIEVQVSRKLIFSVKNNWISLIKRADGRTVEVNPKDLLDLTLNKK